MKKLLILLLLVPSLSLAEKINIKGFELGMSKIEVKKNINEIGIKSKWLNAKLWNHKYMTLAGIDTSLPKIWYNEDKNVKELAWFICYNDDEGCAMQGDAGHTPVSFNIINLALIKKFNMICKDYELQNGFGAKFTNSKCYYHDKHEGTLETNRFESGDLKTGTIRIYPTEIYLKKFKDNSDDL